MRRRAGGIDGHYAHLARPRSTCCGPCWHCTKERGCGNTSSGPSKWRRRLSGSSAAPGGGCFDTALPILSRRQFLPREQPVLDNAHWAEALLTLSYLTGDARYSERADAALKIFEGVVPGKSYLGGHSSRRMEEDEEALFLPAGAAWGRAKDMLEHGPVSLVLVGDFVRPRLTGDCIKRPCEHTLLTGSCSRWIRSGTPPGSASWASPMTGRRQYTCASKTAAWLPSPPRGASATP